MNFVLSSVKYLFLFIVFIMLVLWASSGWILNTGIQTLLKQSQPEISFKADSLSFNPFTLVLSAKAINVNKASELDLSIQSLSLNLDSWGLLKNKVLIEPIELVDIAIAVSQPDTKITLVESALLIEQVELDLTDFSVFIEIAGEVNADISQQLLVLLEDETESEQTSQQTQIQKQIIQQDIGVESSRFSSQLHIRPNKDSVDMKALSVLVSDFTLNTDKVSLQQPTQEVEVEALTFAINQTEINLDKMLTVAGKLSLSIDDIELDMLQSAINEKSEKDDETNNTAIEVKGLAILPTAFSFQQNLTPAQTTAKQQTHPATIEYWFEQIKNKQVITIDIDDKTVEPELEKVIKIDKIQVNNLTQNWRQSDISMNGVSDLFSSINLIGKQAMSSATTNSETPFNVAAEIKGLDMVAFSPYISKSTGMTFDRGNVDLDLDLAIHPVILDGELLINLKGLELANQSSDAESVNNEMGMSSVSMNLALGQLADSKGNLELAMPLKGSVEEPEVMMTGIMTLIMKKITAEVTKYYLVQTFVPFSNIVSVAEFALNKALEINIAPFKFEPNSDSISDTKKALIKEYSNLLEKKQDLQVVICPVSTYKDLQVTDAEAVLTKVQKKQLLALAKSRKEKFISELTQNNIDAGRLVSCAASIEADTKQSGYLQFDAKQ